jgi:hypothetical protein
MGVQYNKNVVHNRIMLPTSNLKGHFRRMERHSHLLLRFPKVFLCLIKSKKIDVMKVSVFTILLAATASLSGVYGQNMEVSAKNSNHSQRVNLPSSNVTIMIVPSYSNRDRQQGSGARNREAIEATAVEVCKDVSFFFPTDNLRIFTRKTNHWSVNCRVLISMEQHTKWSVWQTVQIVGLEETISKVVKVHSSLPPVLKSMMIQTSSSFHLDQPFR